MRLIIPQILGVSAALMSGASAFAETAQRCGDGEGQATYRCESSQSSDERATVRVAPAQGSALRQRSHSSQQPGQRATFAPNESDQQDTPAIER